MQITSPNATSTVGSHFQKLAASSYHYTTAQSYSSLLLGKCFSPTLCYSSAPHTLDGIQAESADMEADKRDCSFCEQKSGSEHKEMTVLLVLKCECFLVYCLK